MDLATRVEQQLFLQEAAPLERAINHWLVLQRDEVHGYHGRFAPTGGHAPGIGSGKVKTEHYHFVPEAEAPHHARYLYHTDQAREHRLAREVSVIHRQEATARKDREGVRKAREEEAFHKDMQTLHRGQITGNREQADKLQQRWGERGGDNGTLAVIASHHDPGPEFARHEEAYYSDLGLSLETQKKNISDTLDRAHQNPEGDLSQHPLVRGWYLNDAHPTGERQAAILGRDPRILYGVNAAISPRREWTNNKDAAFSIVYWHDNLDRAEPIEVTHDVATGWNTYKANADKIASGEVPSLEVPREGSSYILRLSDHADNPYLIVSLGDKQGAIHLVHPDGSPIRSSLTGETLSLHSPSGAEPTSDAFHIVRTGDVNSFLTGPKTRNFFNNQHVPLDNRFVTVDTHAFVINAGSRESIIYLPVKGGRRKMTIQEYLDERQAAADAKAIAKGDKIKKLNAHEVIGGGLFSRAGGDDLAFAPKNAMGYGLPAQAYLELADEKGLLPNELQAITWVQRRFEFDPRKYPIPPW